MAMVVSESVRSAATNRSRSALPTWSRAASWLTGSGSLQNWTATHMCLPSKPVTWTLFCVERGLRRDEKPPFRDEADNGNDDEDDPLEGIDLADRTEGRLVVDELRQHPTEDEDDDRQATQDRQQPLPQRRLLGRSAVLARLVRHGEWVSSPMSLLACRRP